MEVTLVSFEEHKFSNRGFLIGPYCPIYGWAMVFITLFLNNVNNLFLLFVLIFLICGVLEYSISFLMEKIFKLRWWDYSKRKFNINGRICLGTLIPFSILATMALKYLNPLIYKIIDSIPNSIIDIITIILIIIFIVDNIISHKIISTIKKRKGNTKKDSTDIIKKEINKRINNI